MRVTVVVLVMLLAAAPGVSASEAPAGEIACSRLESPVSPGDADCAGCGACCLDDPAEDQRLPVPAPSPGTGAMSASIFSQPTPPGSAPAPIATAFPARPDVSSSPAARGFAPLLC